MEGGEISIQPIAERRESPRQRPFHLQTLFDNNDGKVFLRKSLPFHFLLLPLHPSNPQRCPDGGIGRRAGLKHQWSNPSRFEPGSGYFYCNAIIAKVLQTKTLAIFPFPICSISIGFDCIHRRSIIAVPIRFHSFFAITFASLKMFLYLCRKISNYG